MEERERELAGEFNRWYDLVRPGADFFVNRVKKYNPHATSIALKHALRPIPQSQIDGVVEGPKYPQNPGYCKPTPHSRLTLFPTATRRSPPSSAPRTSSRA